jgi:hypothetical protein
MSLKLVNAFQVTSEEHADSFERFANAFLVDDYPEIHPLGGKKDKGMDAYVYDDEDGNAAVVVQSCVSPASRARAKVLATIGKLRKNRLLPKVLVYCTSDNVGVELDETRKELRRDCNVTLDVRDAAWFVSRHQTSRNRAAISDTYARETLEPIVRSLQPDRLYSLVLNESQQRVAAQYLEAVSLDRSKGGNLTKGIFDALVACVTRDSEPPARTYTDEAIVRAICEMFPPGHASRIKEIVPGRIQHLVNNKALHLDVKAGGYVMSFRYRERVQANIQIAQNRELAFVAALGDAVRRAADDLKVDYAFQADKIVDIGHQAVLWYLREQGKVVSDPTAALLSILNAEKLIEEFLKVHPLPRPTAVSPLTAEQVMDLLPPALFATLNKNDDEVRRFIRGKADLFIVHGFLQVTPDVQEACRKLLGGDVLYLDTTVLIRCLADHYTTAGGRKPLLDTFEAAKKLGYQLRTWRPYIGELVSHLRNRVKQEWANHYRDRSPEELSVLLRTARPLIRVFCARAAEDHRSLSDIVEEIIGSTNEQENAVEYLEEVFGIETDDLPERDSTDKALYEHVHSLWSKAKRQPEDVSKERFDTLVNNDASAYVAIITLRRKQKPDGPDYGHKLWCLSLDRMPWRIAQKMSPKRDPQYQVAMSLSYLMNCVATLAYTGQARIPEDLIPATTILEEAEAIPAEIRAVYEKEFKLTDKQFLRIRQLRDLAHNLKASRPTPSDLVGAVDYPEVTLEGES